MTRDYAKKSANRNRNKRHNNKPPGAPGWVWLVAGVLLGVLATTLVKLSDVDPERRDQSAREATSPGAGPEPRFDFYTLLRETEVIVPDSESPAVVETATRQNSVFLLQVGSFKSAEDADSLRARLLLLNLQATIEKVTPRPGETWHRVLVGPFTSDASLSSARTKLASNQIDSLLLKRKR